MAFADETYTWGATHGAALLASQGYIDFAPTSGMGTKIRVYSDGRVQHVGIEAAPRPAPSGFLRIDIKTERNIRKADGTLDPLHYYVFAYIVLDHAAWRPSNPELPPDAPYTADVLFRYGDYSEGIPGFRSAA